VGRITRRDAVLIIEYPSRPTVSSYDEVLDIVKIGCQLY
jgi:hypothetical protein